MTARPPGSDDETRDRPRRASRREHAPPGSVYWMESSKRRQALEWLRRHDLTDVERAALSEFAARWRTGVDVVAAERRRLLAAFERVERRLRHDAAGTTAIVPPPRARP